MRGVRTGLSSYAVRYLLLTLTMYLFAWPILLILTFAATVRTSIIPLGFSGHSATSTANNKPLPLILWHGLGDNFNADGIKSVAKLASEVHPGTYVFPIRLANDSSADQRASFFGNITEQIDSVCKDISNHPVLSKAQAVNALGFSQGGQFLRGYVERCNTPPVRNLVTFGSQHNGISKFSKCGDGDWLCKAAFGLLGANTWSAFVQSRLVPAQYFRDPEDLESYLVGSNFLADVNNERGLKNGIYKKRLSTLKSFVMYMFRDDETVHPKESAWWAEVNGTTGVITPLRNRTIYEEDWLGLRDLDEKGALEFREIPGKHMEINEQVLKEAFEKYFGPEEVVSYRYFTAGASYLEDRVRLGS